MSPAEFQYALMQLYSLHPFSETGGQRTRSRNDDVDGVAHSPHLFWVGRDVVFDKPPTVAECGELGRRLGIRILKEHDHHHIQPADWLAG